MVSVFVSQVHDRDVAGCCRSPVPRISSANCWHLFRSFSGRLGQLKYALLPSRRNEPKQLHHVAAGRGPSRGALNLIPALGEEIGWRGWLWPRLQPLGQIPAISISGVVWGLWHAPLVLLGYNYPFAGGVSGVFYMCGMCIVVGAFFAWLRTMCNSVWPSALAHGIFNASAGLMIWFTMFGSVIDTRNASILGWSGWIVPAALIAVMACRGSFKARAEDTISTTRSRSTQRFNI